MLTDKETAIAREMLARGDRARALLALRRKKYQESLLAKTDAQLEQLERLTSSVEFALIQKDVLFGLQQGTRVLREIQAEMGGLEHVEKLMGETADAIAYQRVRLRLSSFLSPCSFFPSPSSLLTGAGAHDDRKSARSSPAGCRTRTRRRSRTRWPPWRPKSPRTAPARSNCQVSPTPSCRRSRPGRRLGLSRSKPGRRQAGRPC